MTDLRALLAPIRERLAADCEGSDKCNASSHVEGCFSTNPDFKRDSAAPTDLPRLLAAIEAGMTMLDERAQAFRETATRLNQQVIDRDPDRDAAAAERYSHYASQVESTAYAFRRTVAAALGSDTTNQEGSR